MIGKEYEIPKKFVEIVEKETDSIDAHSSAMSFHSAKRLSHMRRLWEAIGEALPGLDFDKYEYTLDGSTVICVGNKG